MDMDLHEQPLGAEANLKLELKEGKMLLSVSYDGKGADASLSLLVDPDYFIDLLAKAIPGEIDDAIFAIIKGALKA